jgi:hypothetical protein
MEHLLDALAHAGRAPRRRWLLPSVALLVIGAAGASVLWMMRSSARAGVRHEASGDHAAAQASGAASWGPDVPLVEHQVTNVGEDDLVELAVLSPNRAELVYRHASGLELRELASSRDRLITLPPGATPSNLATVTFFPGGRSLFFSYGPPTTIATLWEASLDGSPPRKLREGGRYAALSADGQRVAYVGQDAIYVADREGTTSKMLSPLGSDYCVSVAWSPAGDEISTVNVVGGNPAQCRVDIISVERGTSRVLMDNAPLISDGGAGLVWMAPDRIAYVDYGDPDKRPALWQTSTNPAADAPAPRRLYTWAKNDVIGNLSVVGDTFAYARSHRTRRAQVARLAPDGVHFDGAVTPLEGTDDGATWGLVGSFRDGRTVLRHYDDTESTATLFASSPGATPAPLGVSGPFERIELTANDDILTWRKGEPGKTCRLLRFTPRAAPDEAAEKDIGQIPCGAWIRCARRPGAGCFVTDTVQGLSTFSKLDPRTGAIGQPIVRLRGQSQQDRWDVSWDGAKIALPSALSSGFILIDVARGAAQDIDIKPSMVVQSVTFAPDGKHLFAAVLNIPGAPFGAAWVDLEGHAEVLWHSNVTFLTRPMVSPDGRSVAFRSRSYSGDGYTLGPAAP